MISLVRSSSKKLELKTKGSSTNRVAARLDLTSKGNTLLLVVKWAPSEASR